MKGEKIEYLAGRGVCHGGFPSAYPALGSGLTKVEEEKAALMALRIRLARFGAKKRPYYRIVVTNSESPRDGRFLEIIGTYDPLQDPVAVTVKEDLLSLWVSKGATPSDTVASLLKKRPQCRGGVGGLSVTQDPREV